MMKSLIAVTVMSLLSQAHAGLQCRHAFIPPLSQEVIDATLDSLANMRIQIDLAIADGNQSPMTQTTKNNFTKKYAELKRHYEGELTSEQIRQLLVDRVQKRQGIEKENHSKETAARKYLKENAPEKVFRSELTDRVSIAHTGRGGKSQFNEGKSFYNEANDTFYYMNYRRLIARSFKDGIEKEVLSPSADTQNFVVTSDSIIIHAGFEYIYRVDLKTGARTELFDNKNGPATIPKTISPSGTLVAIYENWGIQFYNIADKSLLPIEFDLWKPKKSIFKKIKNFFAANPPPPVLDNYVDGFKFIDDKLVLISAKKDAQFSKALIFNIETGEIFPTDLNAREASYFVTNPETGDILFLGADTIRRINVKDIADFQTKSQIHPSSDYLRGSEAEFDAKVVVDNIAFVSANEIAITTNSHSPIGTVTVLANLDSRATKQTLRSGVEGTKTMGVIYSDQKHNRIFEIGSHRDVSDVNGYSKYFIDTWYRY